MGANSKIQWTDHTFNPWRGCTKVSPGCARCYAETMSGRNPAVLGKWGPNGTRVVASEAKWREPLAWDKSAAKASERHRVFCASLADVFEDWQGPMVDAKGKRLWVDRICSHKPDAPWLAETPQWSFEALRPLTMQDVRERLFNLIDATPNLDWLMLTKRPENIAKMMPKMSWQNGLADLGKGAGKSGVRRNLWLGTSAENQAAADGRIPHLLRVPVAVRFLSVEPMLGAVDLSKYLGQRWECPECGDDDENGKYLAGPKAIYCGVCAGDCGRDVSLRMLGTAIQWVIVGGESGHGSRPCSVEWIRSVVQQCKVAGVPCFVKQLGSHPLETEHTNTASSTRGQVLGLRLRDSKGGNIDEWPSDLRVREFPEVPA